MVEPIPQNGSSPDTEITLSGTPRSASRHSIQQKPWQQRRASFRSDTRNETDEFHQLSTQASRRSSKRQPRWWKIRWFKGMQDDVKRRLPFYLSDWTDAWDYRVVPATVYMYFAKYVEKEPIPMHLLLSGPSCSFRNIKCCLLHVKFSMQMSKTRVALSQASAL